MTERSQSKAERLLQLEQILLAFPEGLRKAEIARRLGVHRSTVGRYIEELSQRLPIWEDDNLVGINRDDYLTQVRLTIHESMAVHLAARLMTTRTDKHNPHAAAALRKLGQALERFAPLVSQHLLASAEVMDGHRLAGTAGKSADIQIGAHPAHQIDQQTLHHPGRFRSSQDTGRRLGHLVH